MPRGHYRRKKRIDPTEQIAEDLATGSLDSKDITAFRDSGDFAKLNLKDKVALQDTELLILRSDIRLLEVRCALYERLLDHITPKRQAE